MKKKETKKKTEKPNHLGAKIAIGVGGTAVVGTTLFLILGGRGRNAMTPGKYNAAVNNDGKQSVLTTDEIAGRESTSQKTDYQSTTGPSRMSKDELENKKILEYLTSYMDKYGGSPDKMKILTKEYKDHNFLEVRIRIDDRDMAVNYLLLKVDGKYYFQSNTFSDLRPGER